MPDLSTRTFLIATTNAGKAREFSILLADFLDPGWEVLDLKSYPEEIPPVEETAETFEGNAVKKALETSLATGSVVLADDSGLEVDYLGKAPGVQTARFAGAEATDEENYSLLLQKLDGVPLEERSARFRVALALALPDNPVSRALLARRGLLFADVGPGAPRSPGQLVAIDERLVVWFDGVLEGKIAVAPQGKGGFGYDPVFLPLGSVRSLAQYSREEKNQISHRGEATQKLRSFLAIP